MIREWRKQIFWRFLQNILNILFIAEGEYSKTAVILNMRKMEIIQVEFAVRFYNQDSQMHLTI
jgi:hypothetical protein